MLAANGQGGCHGRLFWLRSPAVADPQKPRALIPLGTGGGQGSAETPLVMNRELRRPAGAPKAAGAAIIGQSAAHLVERGLGVLFTEAGIRSVSYAAAQDDEYR